jgi:type VI secretion system protein ImpF
MSASHQLRLPLLDRLLDQQADWRPTQAQAIDVLRAAVRRDLEDLLNARRRRLPLPSGLAGLPLSPLGYGIPDPTAGSFTDETSRAALVEEVERTIRLFEPRLTRVSVTLMDSGGELLDRSLHLRVDALLRTDPLPEEVAFETIVHAATLDVTVRGT